MLRRSFSLAYGQVSLASTRPGSDVTNTHDVRPGVECLWGYRDPPPNGWGALWLPPPWLWVFVYAPSIHSVLSGWLVQSGLRWAGSFSSLRVCSVVLGQLAR